MWTLAYSSKEHCANVHPHKALRLAVKSQAQSQGHTRVPGKSARAKCCPTIKCMRALSHYETLFYNVFMATFCIFCWLTESGHEWGWGGLPEKAFNFYKTMIIQIMALMKAYSKMLFPGIFNYCNYVHSCSLSLFYLYIFQNVHRVRRCHWVLSHSGSLPFQDFAACLTQTLTRWHQLSLWGFRA